MLYWIDPKFYPQVQVIRHLCGPACAAKAAVQIGLYQDLPKGLE